MIAEAAFALTAEATAVNPQPDGTLKVERVVIEQKFAADRTPVGEQTETRTLIEDEEERAAAIKAHFEELERVRANG